MALFKCPECDADVSDQAWSCPSCGAINKAHSSQDFLQWVRRFGTPFVVLFIFFGYVLVPAFESAAPALVLCIALTFAYVRWRWWEKD